MNIFTKEYLAINYLNPIGIEKVREYSRMVKDLVYLETSHELIHLALEGKFNTRQVDRMIKFWTIQEQKARVRFIVMDINKTVSPKIKKKADLKEAAAYRNEYNKKWLKDGRRLRKHANNAKKKEEDAIMKEIEAETRSQMSKVKSRKPKKKTFWNVSAKTAKHRKKYE